MKKNIQCLCIKVTYNLVLNRMHLCDAAIMVNNLKSVAGGNSADQLTNLAGSLKKCFVNLESRQLSG
jgi:hypothetical protein